jgi:hypothetical protein
MMVAAVMSAARVGEQSAVERKLVRFQSFFIASLFAHDRQHMFERRG